MLRKILLIILGFILGAMSILFIYGDLNTKGISGLYQTYKTVKQKQKEEDEKLIQEYMTKAIEPKNEKKEKNKWAKSIKYNNKLYVENWYEFYEDLFGKKITKEDIDETKPYLLFGIPNSGSVDLIQALKLPKEIRELQKENIAKVNELMEIFSDKINFVITLEKQDYKLKFDNNPKKLVDYIKENYKIEGVNLFIKNAFEEKPSKLPLTLNYRDILSLNGEEIEYLINEPLSDKYFNQLAWYINHKNYSSKALFPKKISPVYSCSKEFIEHYQAGFNVKGKHPTEKETLEECKKETKYIGYTK